MATLFIGQNKVFLPETDSTNSYAITMLKNVNCMEGTVVYTANQTKGRGQRGNEWMSEPSMNMTLSLIVKPVFLTVKKAFYLSKITALALHDVLTETLNAGQFDIKIKWPNDMLVNGKKIAGVLLENSVVEDKINWTVVGIGLNVNQTQFSGLESATSLKSCNNTDHSIESVMDLLFTHFEKWYLKLKQGKFEEINEHYHRHLFGAGGEHDFQDNTGQFRARILGVNESGLLRLEMADKSEKVYDIKEVSFIL
jgi:BirA family biotin operon repressor/biotin-[acetyl-CoA-carboxylase] ligase